MRNAPQRIAVTVATRGRPEECRRLVDALLEQEIGPERHMRIIVVDNAPQGSALVLPSDERVRLVPESQTGIPFARNRAVREALPWAEVVVFIDDDEVPADQTWLRNLVDAVHTSSAAGATGPVQSVFPSGLPAWITRHPLFQRATHLTGEAVSAAYTNNLALRAEVFEGSERWFDERLRYTGGSDTEMTQRVVQGGGRIVWTNDAPVREEVPATRARVRWVLRRSLRIGANRTQRLQLEQAPARRWAVYAAGSVAEVVGGASLALLTPLIGRSRGLQGLGRACRGVGTLSAMLGRVKVEEYRSVLNEL